jgi:cytochrome P450
MLGFLEKCVQDYGDIVSLRLGPRRIYLLNHPDLVEQVLIAQARNFKKDFSKSQGRALMGNGLLNSWGDVWFRQRRLCQPAFHRDRLACYGSVMIEHIHQQLATWKEGQTRDMYAEMKRISLGCVAKTLFSADIGAAADLVEDSLETILAAFVSRIGKMFPLPLGIPTPQNLRLKRALRHMDQVIYRCIKERRSERHERRDLLALLLGASAEDGSVMSDEEVRDQAMTLLVAGYETTAIGLTWTWYLLSRHPQVEERLAAEVLTVAGDRSIRGDDLPRLPFTERVIQETLRLYPPSYLLGREALSACTLGGYDVPAGQTLWMSQWLMHRDGRYFDHPHDFDPDRWADGLIARLPKCAYFPFGAGPRICIGNTLAQTEIALVTAHIAQQFRFSSPAGAPIHPRPTYTLRPASGMTVVLARR